MAWQVSKRVWDSIKTKDNEKKNVDASERLMLLALADKADEQGICHPKHDTSYQTLGEMVGVNRRSAMRLIENLAEAGHIWKSETVGRGHSNIFIVTIGLSEAETKDRLALIGVADDTNYDDKKVLPETPIIEPEKEMVLPVTQKGVTDDINYQGNGVTDNTQSYLINPSLPTNKSSNEDDKSSLPGNKKSKPRGAREPTEKQLEAQAMFMALVTACHYDLSLISAKERGELNQAEAKMRQNGYRPTDVQGFCEWWYANDWRGKTDQAPTLNDIRSSWGKYKAFLNGEKGGSNPKNGVHRNGSKPTRTRQPGIITAAQGSTGDEKEYADSGSSGGSQGAKPRRAGILSGD